jgi:hypothetical protein
MITFHPSYNGFNFSLNGQAEAIQTIKHMGIKPTEEEVKTIRKQIGEAYTSTNMYFSWANQYLDKLIAGNMVSDIMPRDNHGNVRSTIIVKDNKASFHAYVKESDGGKGLKFITRSIKNGKVVIDNIRYGLDAELIHKH